MAGDRLWRVSVVMRLYRRAGASPLLPYGISDFRIHAARASRFEEMSRLHLENALNARHEARNCAVKFVRRSNDKRCKEARRRRALM